MIEEFCGALPPAMEGGPWGAGSHPGRWWQPHGHCVLWEPWITWTWTICDIVIWASYLAIPLLLFWYLRRTHLVRLLPWIVPFILTCGMGHLFDAVAVWKPWYELVTAGRLSTALVSAASVIGLAYALPQLSLRRVDRAYQSVTVTEEAQEYVDSLLPLAAFVCSSDGGDLAVNTAYVALLGRDIEEVTGYQYLRHVHPDDREIAGARWRAYCLGQIATYKEQFRWDHPDQEMLLQVKGGHRTNGQHYGIVTDHTDKAKYQKLVEVAQNGME